MQTCTPNFMLTLFTIVNQNSIMGDSFIRTYIDDVLRNIRTQVLIKLIKPYTSIEITFISKVRTLMHDP